ncbi:hypothetical protein B0T22DRAFT_483819 [Podospora appendiculata]|uniref:Uncharacterized protein n=1 Tax=Podospora appendiculata TaxID=314037 RepID=A0AAE0X3U2_9PEZI|nr:hypothetical protein B0T22DRAFT_483819 [Podospora appendiculata]
MWIQHDGAMSRLCQTKMLALDLGRRDIPKPLDRSRKWARTDEDDGDDTQVNDENSAVINIQADNDSLNADEKLQIIDKRSGQIREIKRKRNWLARCPCGGGQRGGDQRGGDQQNAAGENTTYNCKLCHQAEEFTDLDRHKQPFLEVHLLPISRAMSYKDMIVYTNQSIVRQTERELMAQKTLFKDEYGFLRDDKYVSPRQQQASQASLVLTARG